MSAKSDAIRTVYTRYRRDPAFTAMRDRGARFVGGVGNLNAAVVFIGEAPGANEDVAGEPFVGKAGKLLDDLMVKAKIHRERVFITNAVKYRPPNNRTPKHGELVASRDYLAQELTIIQPQVVVLLGASAVKIIWHPERPHPMAAIHGKSIERPGRKWTYFAMYHPMALIYNSIIDTGISDMRALAQLCEIRGLRV